MYFVQVGWVLLWTSACFLARFLFVSAPDVNVGSPYALVFARCWTDSVRLPLHSIKWILQATSTTTEQRWEAPRRGPSQPTAAERRWGFNRTQLGIEYEFLWRLLQKQIYSDSQPQTWKSEHLCCRLNIYISNICLRYRYNHRLF